MKVNKLVDYDKTYQNILSSFQMNIKDKNKHLVLLKENKINIKMIKSKIKKLLIIQTMISIAKMKIKMKIIKTKVKKNQHNNNNKLKKLKINNYRIIKEKIITNQK